MKQMGLGGAALAGGVGLCFGGLSSGQESVLGFFCALVPHWVAVKLFEVPGMCVAG